MADYFSSPLYLYAKSDRSSSADIENPGDRYWDRLQDLAYERGDILDKEFYGDYSDKECIVPELPLPLIVRERWFEITVRVELIIVLIRINFLLRFHSGRVSIMRVLFGEIHLVGLGRKSLLLFTNCHIPSLGLSS